MAIQTPRRPRRIGFGQVGVGPRVTSRTPQPTTRGVRPGSRAPAASGVKAAPTPVAPVQEAVPPPIAVSPINLPSSTADRATAGEQFGGSLAQGNRSLRELAQQLGGLSSINQYNFDPGGDPRGFGTLSASNLDIDPNDPNSTMATIGRNLGKNLQFVGDTNQNRNTWNSGLRLTEEDEQRTSANNARTEAMKDYEKARASLVDQMGIGGAYGAYRGALRNANAADDAATAQAIAEARAQAAAVAAANPPAAGVAAAPAAAVQRGNFRPGPAIPGLFDPSWYTPPRRIYKPFAPSWG